MLNEQYDSRPEEAWFELALSDELRCHTDAIAAMGAAARMVGGKLRAGRCGYGEIVQQGEAVKVERDWFTGEMQSLAGEARLLDAFGPEVVDELRDGRTLVVTDCWTDSRSNNPKYRATWESIGTRALIVAPLRRANELRAILYVHEPSPRAWSGAEARLVESAANRTWDAVERARAEAAMRDSEQRFKLATEAHDIGIFDQDRLTGTVVWSEEARRIYDLPSSLVTSHISVWRERVIAEDLERVQSELSAAMQKLESVVPVSFRILRDGETRNIEGACRLVYEADDTCTRIVGTNLDVTERVRGERHRSILIAELNHRVKNTLSIVQAIAQQTTKGMPEEWRIDFERRLATLADAHNLLTERNWDRASIQELAERILANVRPQVHIQGPEVYLQPKTAVLMSMVLHELTTNAMKYGSLSVPKGTAELRWQTDQGRLLLTWKEAGGPRVSAPTAKGFGTKLIERGLRAELGGKVLLEFQEDGVRCTVDAPLANSH